MLRCRLKQMAVARPMRWSMRRPKEPHETRPKKVWQVDLAGGHGEGGMVVETSAADPAPSQPQQPVSQPWGK